MPLPCFSPFFLCLCRGLVLALSAEEGLPSSVRDDLLRRLENP